MLQTLKTAACALALGAVALAGFACRKSDAPVSLAAPASLPAGHYTGTLTIPGISPCEQFASWLDSAHTLKTDVFMTVSATGSRLLLEYEQSNTKSADYFETSAGTLVLTPGHMVGGKRHQTVYYFDLALKPGGPAGTYVATGDWIIQDACEGQAPGYKATLTLKADHPT